jgi:hypothetical protein
MSRGSLRDPMLRAAAEGVQGVDYLRWLGYADDEMARLRDRLGLPVPSGYSQGKPNYQTASNRAQAIREEVERRMGGTFLARDREAIESVVEELITEAAA